MRFPSPEEWLQLVSEFQSSELTQKEFVSKHDVSLGTFQYGLSMRTPGRVKPFLNTDNRCYTRTPHRHASIRTLNGHALARCTLGSDCRTLQSIHRALSGPANISRSSRQGRLLPPSITSSVSSDDSFPPLYAAFWYPVGT